ncbi:type VI secretion system baseplate subunit TssF [Xanthobacter sp. TB0139]|uniref:type VI secretion system baseplate subunit TssF n=1 Tax=Xanthobacter sp. TB0139 TaxID=3459178 RepID=UPI00403A6CED
MSDDLLEYYNRELTYLRHSAEEFAQAHPRIAANLRLSGDAVDDPHIARLMEGVAFLNARISRKLDDEFPELVDTLLEALYPHFLAPVPSMAIVQFQPKPEMQGPQLIPADTEMEAEPVEGEACRFRTRYPVTLWPMELVDASMSGRPFVAPLRGDVSAAAAVLRLSLRCTVPGMTLTELGPDRLRLFLRGNALHIHTLQNLILNRTIGVALADGPNDPAPVFRPPSAVTPVGFGADEQILPYTPQTQQAHRLLMEYFTFPEKFLFFDVDLSAKVLTGAGDTLDIFLYFDRTDTTLERAVSKDWFALGCAPIVNLFSQRAEPVLHGQTRYEHRLIPDARRQGALEIHSIRSIRGTDGAGRQYPVLPFYARHGATQADTPPAFWSAARRAAGPQDPGTEMYLSIHDPHPDRAFSQDIVFSVETLCLNRDLPSRLPYGGGHPHLTPVEGIATLGQILCITPPTPTVRMSTARGRHWALMSHLALNHLSLCGPGGLEALKEILGLYNIRNSADIGLAINGIASMTTRRGVARAPMRAGDAPWADGICRGIDITLEFDDAYFSSRNPYLFAMVLDHFFGLHASINAFTRLTAMMKGQPGTQRTWPARAGFRPLL